MALVAYSDGSDFSDDDAANNCELNINSKCKNESEKLKLSNIVEDNCSKKYTSQDCTNVPALSVVQTKKFNSDIDSLPNVNEEDSDIVNDVPTVNTWKITKGVVLDSKNSEKFKHCKRKKKTKFILPALSCVVVSVQQVKRRKRQPRQKLCLFDSDEEENSSAPAKKATPSPAGTGLFSVLPEPKVSRMLTPYSVSRKISKVPKIKPIIKNVATKEEDLEINNECLMDGDYFSLSNDNSSNIYDTEVEQSVKTLSPIAYKISSPHVENSMETFKNESFTPPSATVATLPPIPSNCATIPTFPPVQPSNSLDDEALIRLMGRKNKGELKNLIEIKADDALMSKEEWMTKVFSEEKPSQSFSRKKGGLPTHQQKRKHQITFLAHQAKERELELKNNWAQNKMTKIQTQSKYGF